MSRVSPIVTRSRGLKIAEKEEHMKEVLRDVNGRVILKMNNMVIVEFEHKNPKNSFCPFVETLPFKLINNKLRVIYCDFPRYRFQPYFKPRDNKKVLKAIEDYLKSYN